MSRQTLQASTSSAPTIERPEDMTPYSRWKVEIEYAEKELVKYHMRGDMVIRKFLDERDSLTADRKWFNIFYANTNILESAIYAALPQPQVSRKFIDYQDDIARVAAIILERNITPDKDDPRDTFDSMMHHTVQDRLIPGLSMAWLRLETDTEEEGAEKETPEPGETPALEQSEPGETPMLEPGEPSHMESPTNGFETAVAPTMTPEEPEPMIRITDQRVCVDYVYWKDFVWSPCRVWEERRWTGRICYMTRDELVERFGTVKGNAVPLNYKPQGVTGSNPSSEPRNEAMEKAVIYELWDRMDRKVFWLCKDYPEMLDTSEDFLQLLDFAPHPRPMLANITTSNTVPRPDYYMIQDQYTELDTVNNRISMLVGACKVVGVYNKAAIGVQRMLQEGYDNQLIPVDDWAMFAEKGGLKGQIDWLPLEVVVMALGRLYEAREAIKGQIYELTGIADIVRGASKASETLGAQKIKAQFASVRIKKLQTEVADFAAEVLRIKGEITVKHIDPEIILRKSNILNTDDAEYAGPALKLLMSEEGFEWRIAIDADTMGQVDYAMEKQERTELLGTVAGFVEKASPMLNDPKWAPLMVSLLKWTIAGFRGSATLEGMLDKQLDKIAKTPPAPPPPSPDAIKAQNLQQQGQMAQQKHQLDMAGKQQDLQIAGQTHQMDLSAKAQSDAMDLNKKRAEASIDIGGKQVEKAFNEHSYRTDRAAETAALVHELRMNNLAHSSALRKANLEDRHAERANEASVAKSRARRSK